MTKSIDPVETPTRRSTVNGALYLGMSQIARLVLTVLSTIIIARLLAPADYGVLAMTGPIIAFVAMFQGMGLSTATVQKSVLTESESNAIFWMNIVLSVLIALLLVAISPLVGAFYSDARAGYITAASGLAMLVSGSGLQHTALLNRQMRFATLSWIDITCATITFVVAATGAMLLRNYWALFLGSLAGTMAQVAMVWSVSSWRPNWRVSFRNTKELLSFGGNLTGFNLVNYVVRNVDSVLIARFAGTSAIGLYDRSYKLMMMPLQNLNTPINRLLLPVLSRLRDQPVLYRHTFVFAVRAVMLAAAPGIAIGVVLSDRLMPFLLGDQWTAAGPIFFWLGLAGLVQPVANMSGMLYLSTGRAAAMMRVGVVSAVITVIGFAIGIQWGAVGIAIALFVTIAVRLPMLFYVATLGNSVRQRDLWAAQIEPLLGSTLGAGFALALLPYFAMIPLLCLTIPVSYACAIALSLVTQEGRRTFGEARTIIGTVLTPVATGVLGRFAGRKYRNRWSDRAGARRPAPTKE